jgi:hypothetical protein
MSAETFEFKCPSCDGVCYLPVNDIGQFIPCPLCGNSIGVTGAEPPPLKRLPVEIASASATDDAINSGPQCYECHRRATRVCQTCGRFFCEEHRTALWGPQCASCGSSYGVISLIVFAVAALAFASFFLIASSGTGSRVDPVKFDSVSTGMPFSQVENLLGPPNHVRSGNARGTRIEGIGPLETAAWNGRGGSWIEVTYDRRGNVVSVSSGQ